MASIEELLVRIDASTENLRRELKRGEDQVSNFDSKVTRSLKGIDSRFERFGSRVAAGIAVAFGAVTLRSVANFAKGTAEAADRVALMESRLKQLTGTNLTFGALVESANRLGVSVDSASGAIGRFAIAGQQIGLTYREVVRLNEVVLQLGRIGGASMQELNSSSVQLAQGLASNRLSGDELRSVLEQMPLVGKQIADSLGVGVGELRKMGSEGKLTADIVSNALLGAAEDVNAEFQKLPETMAQFEARAGTAFTLFQAELSKTISASEGFKSVYSGIADALDNGASNMRRLRGESALPDMVEDIQRLREESETIKALGGDTILGFANPVYVNKLAEIRDLSIEVTEAYARLGRQQKHADEQAKSGGKTTESLSATVETFIEKLRIEADSIGKSNLERQIAINLRRAETEATSELGKEVVKLTTALESEEGQKKIRALQQQLDYAKAEVDLIGQGAADRLKSLAILEKEADLKERNVSLTSDQAAEEVRLAAAIAETATAMENAESLIGLRDNLRMVQAELELVGETAEIRAVTLAILEKENDLKRRGIDLTSEQAKAELHLTEAIERSSARLQQMEASSAYLSDAMERAFDRIGSAITEAFAKGEISALDFGDIAKAVVSELIQDFIKLAAINPLKNLIFGGALPTFGSVFPSIGGLFGVSGAAAGGVGLGGAGSSLFGATQPFTGAASFGSQMFTGGFASPLVYSQAGAGLGLSAPMAIPGAANGAIASGAGSALAPTAAGTGLLQLTSLAAMPFLGMGIAALAGIAMKKDLPRSAAQINAQDGLFGVEHVDVANGGDPAVGQAIGDAASGIANAFLEASGARVAAGAQLGMIGLDQKVIRSTTSSGAYDYNSPDVLGIRGLTKDGRTFDKTEGGQRAAAADFATRNLLDQLISGSLTGLTDSASETIKFGLGNLARNIEATMTEAGFEDFSRRFEILAGWDSLREQMMDFDAVAGDTAARLEKATASQEAFNAQIATMRAEADAAIAESGSGLANIGKFVKDAVALFDPTGGNRFQLRLQLGEGGGTGSIDGMGNVYTSPGENSMRPTLRDIFGFGTQGSGEGAGAALQNQITVFDELIETIDQNLGDNGKLIAAFHNSGDNLDFSISKLTDILEDRGVELQPILDDFFDTDISRERMSEIGDMARFQVDQFFDSLTGAAEAITGPRQLFESIVPAVSPIVEQFENLKAQIEATRPDIEALNEDLAAMGEAVIDVDAKIGEATGQAASAAQNQFLAGLGIAVGEDGTVQSASVDFGAIGSLVETVKGLDENARVLFENDPRGLSGEVQAKIDEILQDGITQIMSGAEDSATTLEQLQMVFGDRIAGFDTAISNASDPLAQFSNQITAAVSALDGQISQLQQSADAAKALAKQFYSTADSFLVDRSLSPLSPGARLAESRRQLLDLQSQFQAGDKTVAPEIQSVSRSFLEAAQDVYGATAQYATESGFVQDLLRGLGDTAMSEMDVALDQLSVLQDIRDRLGVNDNARNFGSNPVRNQSLAALFPEFTGDFGAGSFGSFFSGVSDARRSVAQNIIDTVNFANGGVMTAFGQVPLRKYDMGGIANTPQVALYGEGSLPEAYVPLPDGRSIPVSFAGPSNDNGGVIDAINSLGRRIASLESVLHGDNMMSIDEQRGMRKDMRGSAIAGRRS